MRDDRKTRIINFRVTASVEDQLSSVVDGTSSNSSIDKAARNLMLSALQAKEHERNAKLFDANKLSSFELFQGDAHEILTHLPSRTFGMCLTSPPYWRQRNYGNHPQQLGQERTAEHYINRLADVFSEIYRVLKDDGTLWINIDDSYWKKELVGVPWRLAFELQRRGWFWRSEIVWAKASTPEPVRDRPTRAHEQLLLFSKRRKYFYDYEAVLEPHDNDWAIDCIRKAQEQGVSGRPRSNPFDKDRRHQTGARGITRAEYGALMNPNGKNRRDVWNIKTEKYRGVHSAVMPVALAELCIRAGSRTGDVIIDPFSGTGTTGVAAATRGRRFAGIELLSKNVEISRDRLDQAQSSRLR